MLDVAVVVAERGLSEGLEFLRVVVLKCRKQPGYRSVVREPRVIVALKREDEQSAALAELDGAPVYNHASISLQGGDKHESMMHAGFPEWTEKRWVFPDKLKHTARRTAWNGIDADIIVNRFRDFARQRS